MVAFDTCGQKGSALTAVQEFYPQSAGRAGTSSAGAGYCSKSTNVYKMGKCCLKASPQPLVLSSTSGSLLNLWTSPQPLDLSPTSGPLFNLWAFPQPLGLSPTSGPLPNLWASLQPLGLSPASIAFLHKVILYATVFIGQ